MVRDCGSIEFFFRHKTIQEKSDSNQKLPSEALEFSCAGIGKSGNL